MIIGRGLKKVISSQYKKQYLLNEKFIKDLNLDTIADSWTFSKHASHTITTSIDGGQKLDMTASGNSGASSYMRQQVTCKSAGKQATFKVDLLTVPTTGALTIHLQVSFRFNSTVISELSTGWDTYNTQKTETLKGIIPATTNNIVIMIYCYNDTTNATGQFYIRNSKLIV